MTAAPPPDKSPEIIREDNHAPLGFLGGGGKNSKRAKVLQVINANKSDSLFRSLVTDEMLGRVVAKLAGWKGGTRLAQDQVWAK